MVRGVTGNSGYENIEHKEYFSKDAEKQKKKQDKDLDKKMGQAKVKLDKMAADKKAESPNIKDIKSRTYTAEEVKTHKAQFNNEPYESLNEKGEETLGSPSEKIKGQRKEPKTTNKVANTWNPPGKGDFSISAEQSSLLKKKEEKKPEKS